MCHSPAWTGSAKKKCRWNVQTRGSFRTSLAGSPDPSWTFTVPLFPGVSTAIALVGASRATSAMATTESQASDRPLAWRVTRLRADIIPASDITHREVRRWSPDAMVAGVSTHRCDPPATEKPRSVAIPFQERGRSDRRRVRSGDAMERRLVRQGRVSRRRLMSRAAVRPGRLMPWRLLPRPSDGARRPYRAASRHRAARIPPRPRVARAT